MCGEPAAAGKNAAVIRAALRSRDRRRRSHRCGGGRQRNTVTSSEVATGLDRTEHPEHSHVARGLVASGVEENFIERTVAAVAGQLPHTGVLAHRITAGVPAQPIDRCADRAQPPTSPGSRARLAQPAADRFEVLYRPRRIDQPARHAAAGSATPGRGWRQLAVGPDAVDPGINIVGVNIEPGVQLGAGLGDHLRFPGQPGSRFLLAFKAGGRRADATWRGAINAGQHRRAFGQLPALRDTPFS